MPQIALDCDRSQALFRVFDENGNETRFIADDSAPIVFDNPHTILVIRISLVVAASRGAQFTLAPDDLPRLNYFDSKVPIRGLDYILTTRRKMWKCKSQIWCKKGEQFEAPPTLRFKNGTIVKFDIIGCRGCYEFGDNTRISTEAGGVEYIKTSGKIKYCIEAAIIEVFGVIVVNGAVDSDFNIGDTEEVYNSHDEFAEAKGRGIWSYLGYGRIYSQQAGYICPLSSLEGEKAGMVQIPSILARINRGDLF